MDPTSYMDDFIVSFFTQTLSLQSPNIMEAVAVFGTGAGKKALPSGIAVSKSDCECTARSIWEVLLSSPCQCVPASSYHAVTLLPFCLSPARLV